jgi:hypothetical protein
MFFWVSPRRQIKFCRRFGILCQVHLQRLDVATPWRHPKEHIQDSEHGENLKSRMIKYVSRITAYLLLTRKLYIPSQQVNNNNIYLPHLQRPTVQEDS